MQLNVILQNLHRRVQLLGDEGLRVRAQGLVVNIHRGLKNMQISCYLTKNEKKAPAVDEIDEKREK